MVVEGEIPLGPYNGRSMVIANVMLASAGPTSISMPELALVLPLITLALEHRRVSEVFRRHNDDEE